MPLKVIDGTRGPSRTQASLQAACDLLHGAPDRVTSVSVSGRLPEPGSGAFPVMAAAEQLAAEYEFTVSLHLDGADFIVHFSRREAAAAPRAS